MCQHGFPSDGRSLLVGDASMWISLTAIAAPREHLRALGCRSAITDVALNELDRGRHKGRRAADEVSALVDAGLIDVVRIDAEDEDLYLSLVSGPASETLDDGEAATLACASSRGAIAVIDERKATLIARRRMPDVVLRSTTDVFLAEQVIKILGPEVASRALFSALTETRMRVPQARIGDVLDLIGPERARECASLPAAIRNSHRSVQEDLDAGLSLSSSVESVGGR